MLYLHYRIQVLHRLNIGESCSKCFLMPRRMNPNNPSYNPNLKFFIDHSNIERWKVFIKGPIDTPYQKKWWYLHATFLEFYPVQHLDFRFITVPFNHIVLPDGVIYTDSLNNYKTSMHIVEIIENLIQDVFLLPYFGNHVSILILDYSDEYNKLALKSASNAKNEYSDYIGKSRVCDEVSDDFCLEFGENIPFFMLSQVSGKQIPLERIVIASSGVPYDRDELMKLVNSNRNPICVITGKILTEKPEDFINGKI